MSEQKKKSTNSPSRLANLAGLGSRIKTKGILKQRAGSVIEGLLAKGQNLVPAPKDRFPIRNAIATWIFSKSGTSILSDKEFNEPKDKLKHQEDGPDTHYGEGASRKNISIVW